MQVRPSLCARAAGLHGLSAWQGIVFLQAFIASRPGGKSGCRASAQLHRMPLHRRVAATVLQACAQLVSC